MSKTLEPQLPHLNQKEKDTFFKDVEGIARKLLKQQSPLRNKRDTWSYMPEGVVSIHNSVKGFRDFVYYSHRNHDNRGGICILSECEKKMESLFIPTFEISASFNEIDIDKDVMAKKIVDAICLREQKIIDEVSLFRSQKVYFSICYDLLVCGSMICADDYDLYGLVAGEQVSIAIKMKNHIDVIFSRKNKNTLKKLLYIPELYQNVFYANKEKFIDLIRKFS